MARELAPGVTEDDAGVVHIDAALVCIALGYDPTPENQDEVERAARKVFAGAAVEVDDAG